MALAIFGLLTGRVLDRKLPVFPMRSWIAAHAILGFVYGSILFVVSAPSDAPPTAYDSAWYVAGGAALGLMVGLLIGGIQAFVLRRAARGSVLWVGYSALAGLSSVITFPVEFYGPQAGTAHDLIANGLTSSKASWRDACCSLPCCACARSAIIPFRCCSNDGCWCHGCCVSCARAPVDRCDRAQRRHPDGRNHARHHPRPDAVGRRFRVRGRS